MNFLILICTTIALVLSALVSMVTVINYATLRRLPKQCTSRRYPSVSVLIPARDEADVIQRCIESLISQDYPNLTIWVLDDQSTDGTSDLVMSMRDEDPRLNLIHGKPVPRGWIGKHWACHQLSQVASGDLLLFTDADTWFEKSTITKAVASLSESDVGLLSLIPGRETSSLLQKLSLPFIDWFVFGWFPVSLANKLKTSYISMAFGQFLLFKRESYEKIGGYAGIRDIVVDDMELGRRINKANLGLKLLDGTSHVRCHMYRDNRSLILGLARNIFPSMKFNMAYFTTSWVVLTGMGVMPAIIVFGRGLGFTFTWAPTIPPVIILGMLSISWCISLRRTPHPTWLGILHPVITAVLLIFALWSVIRAKQGSLSWKGRSIQH